MALRVHVKGCTLATVSVASRNDWRAGYKTHAHRTKTSERTSVNTINKTEKISMAPAQG